MNYIAIPGIIRHELLTTRAYNLVKGDLFIMLGYTYIVRKKDSEFIYYTCFSDKRSLPGYSSKMGINSQQLIQLKTTD